MLIQIPSGKHYGDINLPDQSQLVDCGIVFNLSHPFLETKEKAEAIQWD
jgi:hypothetical protein